MRGIVYGHQKLCLTRSQHVRYCHHFPDPEEPSTIAICDRDRDGVLSYMYMS